MFRRLITAGTKGTATKVPQIVYGPYGEILSVVEVTISGAGLDTTAVHSGDTAGGDLGGTYPNPTVDGYAAWTSYTPQIDQGVTTNIAKTINYAKYVQMGKTVIVEVRVTFTGAGTAGSAITCTLPVNPSAGVNVQIGSGFYVDASTALQYRAMFRWNGTQTDGARTDTTTSTAIGGDPSIAVANADILAFVAVYEVA